MLVGASDKPLAFRLLGPYVMMESGGYTDPRDGTEVTLFDVAYAPAAVAALSEADTRVTLRLGDEAITLYRLR